MKNLNEEDNNAYLLALDTSGGVGRAIVSEGNPDTADNVATLVPGTDTDWMSVNGQHGRAQRLKSDADAVLGEDSGVNNAVISWIGYDAPTKVEAPFPFNVKSGADELIDFQAGLSATQQGNPPNTTLIGHSYGSTVVGHALQKSERASSDDDQNSGPLLEVDNVIAVGSPGMDVQHVSELNIPSSNVHVSQGDDDWISSTPDWAHGSDPSSDEFGATVFDSPGYGHSDYFNTPRSGPMVYMGEVIAGTR
nr:alpha/beta hydrolase [Nocardiopsis mwathae]